MKKMLALMLAVVLAMAAFSVSAGAESAFDDLIKVLITSPGVATGKAAQSPTDQELDDAIEAGSSLIPAGCKLKPGRVTLMNTGSVCCEDPIFHVTFKVWSTYNRTIGLFFRAEDSDQWQLMSCNLGDVIEGHFETCGDYAIAVGW